MVSDNNVQDMTRSPLNYLDIFSHHNQDVGASRNKKQTEKGILINDNVAKGLFSREKHKQRSFEVIPTIYGAAWYNDDITLPVAFNFQKIIRVS